MKKAVLILLSFIMLGLIRTPQASAAFPATGDFTITPETGQIQIDVGERAFVRLLNIPKTPGSYNIAFLELPPKEITITVDSNGKCTWQYTPQNSQLFINKDLTYCGIPTGQENIQFSAWIDTDGLNIDPSDPLTVHTATLSNHLTGQVLWNYDFPIHNAAKEAKVNIQPQIIHTDQQTTISASNCPTDKPITFKWTWFDRDASEKKVDPGQNSFTKNFENPGSYELWATCSTQTTAKKKFDVLSKETLTIDKTSYQNGEPVNVSLAGLTANDCYGVVLIKINDSDTETIHSDNIDNNCEDKSFLYASSDNWGESTSFAVNDLEEGEYNIALTSKLKEGFLGQFKDFVLDDRFYGGFIKTTLRIEVGVLTLGQSEIARAAYKKILDNNNDINLLTGASFVVGTPGTPTPAPKALPPCKVAFTYKRDGLGQIEKENGQPIKIKVTIPPDLSGQAEDEFINEHKLDGCEVVDTAVGGIDVNPTDLLKSLMAVLLSLSGGIALILIIYSGYRIMTSRGDPERLQAAKDRLTSAIVGLLFIIFALVIVEVIGVDILQIPGFTR